MSTSSSILYFLSGVVCVCVSAIGPHINAVATLELVELAFHSITILMATNEVKKKMALA